jgi:hypothetical protein
MADSFTLVLSKLTRAILSLNEASTDTIPSSLLTLLVIAFSQSVQCIPTLNSVLVLAKAFVAEAFPFSPDELQAANESAAKTKQIAIIFMIVIFSSFEQLTQENKNQKYKILQSSCKHFVAVSVENIPNFFDQQSNPKGLQR